MTKQRYISIICSLFLVAGLVSCDVVNLQPQSQLTETNYYQTADQLENVALAVYGSYQAKFPRHWPLLEMPTDHLYMSEYRFIGGLEGINNLSFQPTNDIFWDHWRFTYNGIFRANSILTNIDNPEDYSGNMRQQLEGEAKLMRALNYFDLVRAFGGVPLVDDVLAPDASMDEPRASEEEIYDFIVSDLQDAVDMLPTQDNIANGRATQAAANALLGKVYVYMGEWEDALTHLNNVPEPEYGLVDDFDSIWSLDNENNQEVIFAMQYIEGSDGHTLSTDFVPYPGAEGIVPFGGEVALPAWSLMSQYDDEDSRYETTITEMWKDPNADESEPEEWFPYVSKFAVEHTRNSSGLDLPVLRFADVVLLKAEALLQLDREGEALTEINKVRERAFGDASNNYTSLTLEDIMNERQLEFAYENERWFDVRRLGGVDAMQEEFGQVARSYNPNEDEAQEVSLNVEEHYVHFPIPQRAIDRANEGVIEPNPGY